MNSKQYYKYLHMMSKQEKFARRSAMGMMREDGKTLEEIGKRFNLSTDAVRVNLMKINFKSKTCPFIKNGGN